MKRDSTILSVASGKGGVGKSIVAVNLAEMLSMEGHNVALIDADFGQSACPVLLNESPAVTAFDVACQTRRPDAALHTTAAGLTLVQAVASPGDADGRHQALYDTLDQMIYDLQRTHSYVIIDTPAGTDGPVRWALDRADLGLLVLVGEPTAIADAYRLAKLIWTSDPAYPLGAIVNFTDSESEARSVAERFGKVTERFTRQQPDFIGWVPFSSHVRRSVQHQRPAVRSDGPVRCAFADLSRVIVQGRQVELTPAGF